MRQRSHYRPRIDAMVPITTWRDFTGSLAPNAVPKSGWFIPTNQSPNIDTDGGNGSLEPGDIVGTWLFGYHNQYRFSHSGWFMGASLEGLIQLPLLDSRPKRISSRN